MPNWDVGRNVPLPLSPSLLTGSLCLLGFNASLTAFIVQHPPDCPRRAARQLWRHCAPPARSSPGCCNAGRRVPFVPLSASEETEAQSVTVMLAFVWPASQEQFLHFKWWRKRVKRSLVFGDARNDTEFTFRCPRRRFSWVESGFEVADTSHLSVFNHQALLIHCGKKSEKSASPAFGP